VRDAKGSQRTFLLGNGRLGQDRDTGARCDEIGDEAYAFDLDRDAQLDPFRARRGLELVA
jgi:hypothetical protein